MEPGDKIVECAVTVQRVAPPDHINELIFAGVIVGVVFLIVLGITLFHWTEKRNRERDTELAALRKIVKSQGLMPAGVL